jgi:hypothetical protein
MRQRTSYHLLITFLLFGHLSIGQTTQNTKDTLKTLDSKVSECLTNCSIKSEVISSKLTNNVLNIKVGAHLNCSVNPSSRITYILRGETLNIIIPETQVKRDTIVSKTDSTQTVTISETKSSTSCRCFFHIDLTIKNCKTVPKTILINGLTLAENYNRRTIIEEEK